MYYQFDTESVKHAQAALLLYAMYRSRNKNSPLNGMETWSRFNGFVQKAVMKSTTTAEFVQNFCESASIDSIKPRYLQTGDPVAMPDGALIQSDEIKDFRAEIFEDNEILGLYDREGLYIITLIRERIQREKMEVTEDEENND